MKPLFPFFGLITLLSLGPTGCRTSSEAVAPRRRPPVGIVRSVNLAERYVIFEAEFRIPPGMDMRLLRDNRPVGLLKSQRYRRRKFQAADILEGRPQQGDLVEPVSAVEPQPAQQTEGGRLSP